MDVWEYATRRDCYAAKQLVEFFIIANGELQVPGDDARFFVVAGSVAGELENFGTKIFEDGREVDGSASPNARRILALLEVSPNATNRELQPSLGGTRRCFTSASFTLTASTFSFTRHGDDTG